MAFYIGWFGAFIFIVSYLLLSLEYISAQKYFYHILNAVGAICLVINAIVINDHPNIFVNGMWGVIAVFAVYKRFRHRKRINSISEIEQS